VALVKSGEANAALIFRPGFGDGALTGRALLEGYVDESNTFMAGMVNSALNSLVNETNFALLGQQKPISLDLRGVQAERLRNIDYLTPGLLGMMVMWANLYVGARLVFWRERKILRRLGVTPLRPSVLIGSQIIAQAIFSLLQAVALVAIARLWFGVPIKGSYLLLGLTLLLGILTMLAFGYIVGSFVRKSDNASTVTMIIAFPMMFLGGSYFPTDSAPAFMKALANAMPLTYLNGALREIVNNGSGIATLRVDYLVMLGWVLLSLLVSTRLFRWD
jgi:ABC-2 type transport system permease protein